jgi:hypothetical protein
VASELKRRTARTRSIVVAALAMLGLTALLTLLSETIWKRPMQIGKTEPTSTPISTSTKSGPPPRVTLPMPANSAIITVVVAFDAIKVDGLDIVPMPVLLDAGNKVGNIQGLQAVLDEKRGGASVGGRVGIIVERGMPRSVIKSVLLTLRLARYNDVHLIVPPDAGAAAPVLDDD